MSITTYTKPQPHISLADWHCEIFSIRNDADVRSQDAMKIRNEAHQLRNETTIKTKWDTYLNDVRLADRVGEMREWQRVLGRCLSDVEREVAQSEDEKALAEAALADVALDAAVLNQCLTLRDARPRCDLVADAVHCELMNELRVLDAVKGALASHAQACWEQAGRLKEARFLLRLDLFDKEEAVRADEANLALPALEAGPAAAAGVGRKPDPLRRPANMVTYGAWADAMRRHREQGDAAAAVARRLREGLAALRLRSRNDLAAQHAATDYALRARLHELGRAAEELRWQRAKAAAEAARVADELRSLERAQAAQAAARARAETRLEARLARPSPELVLDEAQAGLADEVRALRGAGAALAARAERVAAALAGLQALEQSLERAAVAKADAQALEQACLDVRRRLYARQAPLLGDAPDQTERNRQLLRMHDADADAHAP